MSNYWNKSIRDVFHLGVTEGDIGIEIEMEGYDLPSFEYVDCNWRSVHDGSLRGESMEYVLKQPVPISDVRVQLRDLYARFDERGSDLKPSDRCGVHVHINVQTYTQAEVHRIVTLYYVLEEVLMRTLPKHRQGNMFCMRGSDAMEQLYLLRQCVTRGSWRYIQEDHVRYAAINLGSLAKYGSLEFRAFPTTTNYREIEQWVQMLYAIVTAALKYEEPRHIIEGMSAAGEALLDEVFGWDLAQSLHCLNAGRMMMSGARRVQALAYATPGEWINEMEDDIPWDECPDPEDEDDWHNWLEEHALGEDDYWERQEPPIPVDPAEDLGNIFRDDAAGIAGDRHVQWRVQIRNPNGDGNGN